MNTGEPNLIFLVDDDFAVTDSISMLLRAIDQSVETFTTGDLALSALAAGARPELVITDLKMPGLSGLDLITQIRERGHQCPCILLTGSTGTTIDESECVVLHKPVDPDQLLTLIRQLTNQH